MRYLQKDWLRGLLSLLLAGAAMEALTIATGYGNGQRMPGSAWFVVVATAVFYVLLSALANRKSRKD